MCGDPYLELIQALHLRRSGAIGAATAATRARPIMAGPLLAAALVAAAQATVHHVASAALNPEAQEGTSSITLYSDPFELRYGEVYMSADYEQRALPPEVVERYAGARRMAVTSWTPDLVRRHADGSETSVPLSEVYNHHAKFHLVDDGFERGIGTGADYRGTLEVYQAPFRAVFDHPRAWSYFAHLINLRRPASVALAASAGSERTFDPLSQCPCTPQRRFNFTSGTIDGEAPDPPFYPCEGQMLEERNPTCTLQTYRGGVRCCAHGMFVTDTGRVCRAPTCTALPVDVVHFKVTVTYEDFDAAVHRELLPTPMEMSGTGVHGEFDVRPCAAGTPPSACLGTHTFVHTIAAPAGVNGTHFRVHSALSHVHSGALSISLQRAGTNETICRNAVDGGGMLYGTGTEAGNEVGYVVGLTPCAWGEDDAPVLTVGEPMRVTAVYNASRYQYGVMATWKLRLFVDDDARD